MIKYIVNHEFGRRLVIDSFSDNLNFGFVGKCHGQRFKAQIKIVYD